MAANPCPCGNLGGRGKACLCSIQELQRYKRKIGGPLLDRIDIRVAVEPTTPERLLGPAGEPGSSVRARIEAAIRIQVNSIAEKMGERSGAQGHCEREAFSGPGRAVLPTRNSCSIGLPTSSSKAGSFVQGMPFDIENRADYLRSRGHSEIGEAQLLEAVQLRRFGDGDEVWPD